MSTVVGINIKEENESTDIVSNTIDLEKKVGKKLRLCIINRNSSIKKNKEIYENQPTNVYVVYAEILLLLNIYKLTNYECFLNQ